MFKCLWCDGDVTPDDRVSIRHSVTVGRLTWVHEKCADEVDRCRGFKERMPSRHATLIVQTVP